MINQKEALKKQIPSLSKSPKFEGICLKNGSFAWSFANAILKFCLETTGLCFLTSSNRLSHEDMKNNENLSVLAASFSRELRHVNTRKHSMTSQLDRHLEYQRDLNQKRLWPGFARLLEQFHVFGRQHKRYLLIFVDSKTQTERFKRMLRSLLRPGGTES